MNGQPIGWDEALPTDTEGVGLGDNRIHSIKTSARIALDDEHNWPSRGEAAGYHRFGAARPYYGTQSRVSSSGTEARLMLTSDTSRLFGVGSGGTVLLGDPRMLSMGTPASTVPQRHYWAVEMGGFDSTATTASPAAVVTFPNSGFSGAPIVLLTKGPLLTNALVMLSAQTITNTGFSPVATTAAGALQSNITYMWMSIGTRVL